MILAFALQAAFACASPGVHDGDNISCGRSLSAGANGQPAGRRQMRLAGIDAPELAGSPRHRGGGDAAGRRARDHLRALVAGRAVTCRLVDATPRVPGFQAADRYGRPVVRCAAAGVGDLGEAMVRAGHARRWR